MHACRSTLEDPTAELFGQILAFVCLGLLSMALIHSEEDGGRQLSWRWLLTLLLAIGGVVLLGSLLGALLGGGTALAAVRVLLGALLLPFALVGAALTWLLLTFFIGPLSALAQALRGLFERFRMLPEPPQEQAGTAPAAQAPGELITTLAQTTTWLMALIPIVLLVLALILLRRRHQAASRADEERESLGLAESLASDLRDLLGRLRNPFARPLVGLRAALAALVGANATTRVRRAYLRLLIDLEPRQPRELAQTPAEYANLAGAVSNAPEPVAALTRAYEAARYDPAGVDDAVATRAEAALADIARAPRLE